MPFDKPRLFPDCRSDRADGASSAAHDCLADDDLGLSAELRLLAAQLRGEGDLIAERYAPAAELQPANPRYSRSKRKLLWQAAAVAAAGLAILVWQFERPWRNDNRASEVGSNAYSGVSSSVAPKTVSSSNSVAAGAKPRSSAPDPIDLRRTQGIAEVGIDAPAVERHPPANQLEMLRLQLSGFEKVIQKLQAELAARDAAQVDAQHQIESLQAEVADLRTQLFEKKAERHDRR